MNGRRFWKSAAACGAAALAMVVCFIQGQQKANAAKDIVGPCAACSCKNIMYVRISSTGNDWGFFVEGTNGTVTTNAYSNLNSGGGCNTNSQQYSGAHCDIWQVSNATLTCSGAGSGFDP